MLERQLLQVAQVGIGTASQSQQEEMDKTCALCASITCPRTQRVSFATPLSVLVANPETNIDRYPLVVKLVNQTKVQMYRGIN